MLAALSLAAAWASVSPAGAGELTPQEQRGKQIYFEGTSPSGVSIEAYIGEELAEIPGSVATCASCHGPDGRGRPEAGVIPSNITWEYLFKPYGHIHPRSSHPAYTVETLKESIVWGRDPAGGTLDPSMPIYSMTDADLDDLVAYLRRLETDYDPGISDNELRIATVVPTKGRMAVVGQAIREVLTAFFAEINRQGGIHHRQLQLIERPYDNERQGPLEEVRRLVDDGDVFALVSPVVAGADREIATLVEEARLPVMGPLTLFSPDPYSLSDYTFYVLSGLREQVRSLVAFAMADPSKAPAHVGVLGGEEAIDQELRLAIEQQFRAHDTDGAVRVEFHPTPTDAQSAVRELAGAGIDAIFVLDSRGLAELLRTGEDIGWRPRVFVPGALARSELFELPHSSRDRICFAYPTTPADQKPAAVAELETLLDRHGFTMRHRTSQVSAFVAARLLVEGLKSSGRDLSRDKLLRALETIFDWRTGLTPPITFGANRRVGALGAYMVTFDPQSGEPVRRGEWITPR